MRPRIGWCPPTEGRSRSIAPVAELDGARITVGSKDFTEQVILGYIIEFALSAAGADVRDLTNIQGSNSTRDAQLAGQIDVSYEYTGTGWINYLGHEEPFPTHEHSSKPSGTRISSATGWCGRIRRR